MDLVITNRVTMITFSLIMGLSLLASSSLTRAGELITPNEFKKGQITSASNINANFKAIKTAVNDNDIRLKAIESGSTRAVFKGFTANTYNLANGLREMRKACNDAFPGSKVCTTGEYANSSYTASEEKLALDGDQKAWILPGGVQATGMDNQIDSVTGKRMGKGGLSCGGYSHSGSHGLVISQNGAISTSRCNLPRKVACCK